MRRRREEDVAWGMTEDAQKRYREPIDDLAVAVKTETCLVEAIRHLSHRPMTWKPAGSGTARFITLDEGHLNALKGDLPDHCEKVIQDVLLGRFASSRSLRHKRRPWAKIWTSGHTCDSHWGLPVLEFRA